ncbi:MAG: hypothetical protein F6K28_48205 [Microcoleus sp. SIO2G3]|nr:hypothetical protein [Microcoleus sp. SIO2G3]
MMPYIITEIRQSEKENSKLDDITTALDYLNELTELRELLEMCLEENSDCEGNTQNIRIRLLIDCYLSRSEYCFDEFRVVLERLRTFVKINDD